jgi:hypothetical protein
MKKHLFPFLPTALFFLSGCFPQTQPAYYSSPMDINSNYYHPIPLRSDSVRSAFYTNFVFSGGGSNKDMRDGIYAFHGGLHRSQNLGIVAVYYGAGLALGSYSVGNYYRIDYSNVLFGPLHADTVSHIPGHNYFFGAYGFNGGVAIVLPSPMGFGEFRIGFETAIQNEFGDYLQFRKSLPDSAIDILATNHWTKTVGGFMEFLTKGRRNGITFGYKISAGGSIISPDTYQGDERSRGPFYFSNTFHLSRGHITGFFQFNFGNYTNTVQTGFNYRLGKL